VGGVLVVFTPETVKALMKNWHLVQLQIRRYHTERADILNRYRKDPILAVPGKGAAPGDPTLSRVQALTNLEERYTRYLTFTRCVRDTIAVLGKRAKAFKLHYIDGLTVRETASRLKLAGSTTHRQIDQALNVLVYYLNEHAAGVVS
jgi:DNA-directed RNA polymerase specialized sigma24 family protein